MKLQFHLNLIIHCFTNTPFALLIKTNGQKQEMNAINRFISKSTTKDICIMLPHYEANALAPPPYDKDYRL